MQATTNNNAKSESTRHLFEAIERVRRDLEQVEFWADAVEEFEQPIPDYEWQPHAIWPGARRDTNGTPA